MLSGRQNACYIPVLVQADKILSSRQNACCIPVLVQADKMHVTYLCWSRQTKCMLHTCAGRMWRAKKPPPRKKRRLVVSDFKRVCRVQPSVHSPQTVILDSGMDTCLRASANCVYVYGVTAGTGVGVGVEVRGEAGVCGRLSPRVLVCVCMCVCVCVCVRMLQPLYVC